MDLRSVFYVIGILLITLAASMILPILADLYVNNDDWKVFAACMLITAFFGGLLTLTTSNHSQKLTPKQGFLMITLVWVVLSLFAALPFRFCALGLSFTDSFFEAVSGLTTTGSTIITDLESAPRGILLWRAMLQWLGGIGIILMAMSVLPFLKVGGMQLFQTELSESEKALPRAAQLASSIGMIYVVLTLICVICYHLAGLDLFEALAHAMSTISTGGYSTYDASFAQFTSVWPLIVGIVFMIIGGIPFVLFLKAVKGNAEPLFRDSQVHWFLGILLVSISALVIYLVLQDQRPVVPSLIHASFNIVSLLTGTGYTSADYGQWGSFAIILLFFLSAVGACAGSTTCGIKIFRFQVLFAVAVVQMRKLLYPHGVFIPHYNGKTIPDSAAGAVMGFFFLYALVFALLAIGLSFTGLDFITSMSGAVTSLSNVGPGLGEIIGPAGNFQPLANSSKWILIFGMLLGRLEMFPVLVLLSPHFWRR